MKKYSTKADAEAMVEQMKITPPKQMIGERTVIVNYEIEYYESNLNLATCVEVTGKFANALGYEEKTLAFSGELATLACKWEQLDDGYHVMLSQNHEIDYQIIGASYEIYYEDGTVELKIPVCKKVKCIDTPTEKQEFENDEAAVVKWKIRDSVTSFLRGGQRDFYIWKQQFRSRILWQILTQSIFKFQPNEYLEVKFMCDR